jgi:hypothetical protein
MSEDVDWTEVRSLLDTLYATTGRLESIFRGRKFTLDGHLVGSVGEVIAAYMFELDLLRCSNKGHDATSVTGRKVEVKLTQGAYVGIRHEPEHLIVLQHPKGKPVSVVFNGPGKPPWERADEMGRNGQRSIRLSALRILDKQVADADRLPVKREAPI